MNQTASAAPAPRPPVLVMGAGTIGCHIGGCLQAAGVPVVLVGRLRALAGLRERRGAARPRGRLRVVPACRCSCTPTCAPCNGASCF